MAQCLGKTKSGSRCKRSAGEGSAYCAAHQDQAPGAARERSAPEIEVDVAEIVHDGEPINTLVVAAAFGAAALVVLAFGKLLRL